MALFSGTQESYYTGSNFGNYQYISLKDLINNFMIGYVGEDKVIRWNILNGGKSNTKGVLDFKAVWDKAKEVGDRFRDLIDVPADITDYTYNFHVDLLKW